MRVLKYVVACAAVLALAGCEKGMDLSPDPQAPGDSHEGDVVPSKPTSPIKRRPIVPTTKLPRPRFAEAKLDECNIKVEVLEDVE